MKEKKVFDALKRDGECWHSNVRKDGYCIECREKMDSYGYYLNYRPDFSTPEGRQWLIERINEKEWKDEFWAELYSLSGAWVYKLINDYFIEPDITVRYTLTPAGERAIGGDRE